MSGRTPLDRLFHQNTMKNFYANNPFGLSLRPSRPAVTYTSRPRVDNLQYINEQRSDPAPLGLGGGFSSPMRPGIPMGGIGMLQAGQVGPLNRLGQFINQELAQENQGEVDEFIGEVGDMANERFGVDLGAVGQRLMFRAEGGPSIGCVISCCASSPIP